MYLGEMTLLIIAVLVMTGLARGITTRLGLNDIVTSVSIFLIVLLNVRGGISIGKDFSLSLGGVLSILLCTYTFIRRKEKASDLLAGFLSMLGCAGISFLYTFHFLSVVQLDPRLLAALLSLLVGLWSALAARRTFASCLFSSVAGSFFGITIYLIFFRKSGNIGGNYTFAVMWIGATVGLLLQYLFAMMMRVTKSPRANSYFEAGEMQEEEKGRE